MAKKITLVKSSYQIDTDLLRAIKVYAAKKSLTLNEIIIKEFRKLTKDGNSNKI